VFRYNVEETKQKRLNLENKVIFHGFHSLHKPVLEIEDRLLCPKVQAEAKGNV
jgi:hypothetical protein